MDFGEALDLDELMRQISLPPAASAPAAAPAPPAAPAPAASAPAASAPAASAPVASAPAEAVVVAAAKAKARARDEPRFVKNSDKHIGNAREQRIKNCAERKLAKANAKLGKAEAVLQVASVAFPDVAKLCDKTPREVGRLRKLNRQAAIPLTHALHIPRKKHPRLGVQGKPDNRQPEPDLCPLPFAPSPLHHPCLTKDGKAWGVGLGVRN